MCCILKLGGRDGGLLKGRECLLSLCGCWKVVRIIPYVKVAHQYLPRLQEGNTVRDVLQDVDIMYITEDVGHYVLGYSPWKEGGI